MRQGVVFYGKNGLQNHEQCSGGDQGCADGGFPCKGFVQEHEGEDQRDDDAELVDGDDL